MKKIKLFINISIIITTILFALYLTISINKLEDKCTYLELMIEDLNQF